MIRRRPSRPPPSRNRIYTLELYVRKCHPNKQRQFPGIQVKKALEMAHALHDEFWWRGNENCIAGACASDPVLASAKHTGFLAASPPARKQDLVNLANEA